MTDKQADSIVVIEGNDGFLGDAGPGFLCAAGAPVDHLQRAGIERLRSLLPHGSGPFQPVAPPAAG